MSYSQFLESCKQTNNESGKSNSQPFITIRTSSNIFGDKKSLNVPIRQCNEPFSKILESCKQSNDKIEQLISPIEVIGTNNKIEQLNPPIEVIGTNDNSVEIPTKRNPELVYVDVNLEFAREWRRDPYYGRILYKKLIEQNRIDFIQWIHENNQCDFIDEACDLVILYGNLDIVKLVSKYANKNYNFCANGAKYGKLDVIEWAFDNCYGLTVWVSYYAAESKRLDILKWAHSNDCEMTAWVCYFAAKNNDLLMLQWARAKGCAWNKSMCTVAARKGHLEIIKWAIKNGCPYDKNACLEAVATGRMESGFYNISNCYYQKMCKWINENLEPIQFIDLNRELNLKNNEVIELQKDTELKDILIFNLEINLKLKDTKIINLQNELNVELSKNTMQKTEKSKIFTIKEYDDFGLINAPEFRKKAIQNIIKSIKIAIEDRFEIGYIDYRLLSGQLKYYDELKYVLEHFKYDVKLISKEKTNTNVIHIEW